MPILETVMQKHKLIKIHIETYFNRIFILTLRKIVAVVVRITSSYIAMVISSTRFFGNLIFRALFKNKFQHHNSTKILIYNQW